MAGIERPLTEQDKVAISEEGVEVRDVKKRTWQDEFTIELNLQNKKCKNLKPFASHIAKEDYYDLVEKWEKDWKRIGYVTKPRPTGKDLNWDKYSNLDNFNLVEETDRPDAELTKHNPGLNVSLKTKRYRWKGDNRFLYTIMESTPDAIQRAVKERAKLDKTLSK